MHHMSVYERTCHSSIDIRVLYVYAFWGSRSCGIKSLLFDVSSGKILLFKIISFSAYAILKLTL